jgi:D-3-phosphoglycerate dehydrogenase
VVSIVLARGTFTESSVEDARAGGRARFVVAPLATPDDVSRHTADADAIIVTNDPLSAAHLEALGPRVRLIARAGIGLDAIDLGAARRRGLAVYHVPDYATSEVANHAVAMILALHRKLRDADELARSGWKDWPTLKPIDALEDLVVGLLGYGRIGRAVASRLRPFGCTIRVFDPFVAVDEDGVEPAASLLDLLRTSDCLSLHLPLTPETKGLLAAAELAQLKLGALLVNVSRGGLVDEAALVAALHAGRLGGAALDVLSHEPPAADAPILLAPRVLLSPHVAWYSQGSERRVRETVVDAILDYLAGRRPAVGRLAIEPER